MTVHCEFKLETCCSRSIAGMMKRLTTAVLNHSQSLMLRDEADSVEDFVQRGFDARQTAGREK